MSLLKSRAARVAVPLVAFGLVAGAAGTVAAVTAGSKDHSAFIVRALYAPPVSTGGSLSQSVAGLWSGPQASFTKVAGSSWLSVDGEGLITGTAPGAAPADPGVITVKATDGDASGEVKVAVRVVGSGQPQRLEAASWNLDNAGSDASWSGEQKAVRAIASAGIQVLGVQETDGTAAKRLGNDLGWHSYQSTGDLGLVSAYPIASVTEPTTSVPALRATVDVGGEPVRVWVTHLDETDYGPYRACNDRATDLASHELSTTRYAQATAVTGAMAGDIAGSQGAAGTPVLLLGDLASPSASDWTAATSATHCNAGAASWPAPAAFTAAGLSDSYRVANPDPASDPGNTWSPLVPTNANGKPEPQDRIDYVDFSGPLQVLGAEALSEGWSSSSGDTVSHWPSDHAAAVTLFSLGGTAAAPGGGPASRQVGAAAGTSTVTGKPAVGSTLRAAADSWAAGTAFAYQWYADGWQLPGATQSAFSPTAVRAGQQISVRVTGTLHGATTTSMSAPVTVRKGKLRHHKPRIGGTARVGARLRVRLRSWHPKPKLAYQWYAAGKAIPGATRSAYRPTAAQRGKHITVRVTGHKAGYKPLAVASVATSSIK